MRTSFGQYSSRPTVDSMMTPMIDVVFLLLIFFLTTASFQKLEKHLPSASASPPEEKLAGSQPSLTPPPPNASDISDIVIKIENADGLIRYKIQDEPVATLAELNQRLGVILAVKRDVPIVIDPANNVAAGDAIRVYDSIRTQGSQSVFMVAR